LLDCIIIIIIVVVVVEDKTLACNVIPRCPTLSLRLGEGGGNFSSKG